MSGRTWWTLRIRGRERLPRGVLFRRVAQPHKFFTTSPGRTGTHAVINLEHNGDDRRQRSCFFLSIYLGRSCLEAFLDFLRIVKSSWKTTPKNVCGSIGKICRAVVRTIHRSHCPHFLDVTRAFRSPRFHPCKLEHPIAVSR